MGQNNDSNTLEKDLIITSASDCWPIFKDNNLAILCREMADQKSLPAPLVNLNCRTIVQLEYQDQYYDLGCSTSGFAGYFDPARWTSIEVSGAGGVDVTGAPAPKLLVEGINNNLIEVANGRQTRFDLVIPTRAYLRFKWDVIGSSTTITDTPSTPVSIRINQQVIPLSKGIENEFFSPLLKAGDQFSIVLEGNQSVVIQQFEFLSNASAVIERKWEALDHAGRRASHIQFIAIERVPLHEVVVPALKELTIHDPFNGLPELHPSESGYPYLDKDGDPITTADRIYLEPGTCDLDVLWEDAIEFSQEGWILHRKWIIHDLCSGNSLEKVEQIKLKIEKKSVSSSRLEFDPYHRNKGSIIELNTILKE